MHERLFLLWFIAAVNFIFLIILYLFIAGHGQYSGNQPKIQFSISKRGGQLLWLDGLKYFRNNENRTNLFWRCHWYYRRVRCPVLICMNKFDSTDFRQIHKHRHVKSIHTKKVLDGGKRARLAATKHKSSHATVGSGAGENATTATIISVSSITSDVVDGGSAPPEMYTI